MLCQRPCTARRGLETLRQGWRVCSVRVRVCVLGESLSSPMCLFRREPGRGKWGSKLHCPDPVPDPRTVSSVTTVRGAAALQ